MANSGAPALEARRVRWTAADLVRSSALAILAAALVLLMISVWDSAPATRDAITVQPLRAEYVGAGALVGALERGDAPARALARTDLDADGAPDLVVGHAWHGAGIVTIQRGNPDAFATKRRSVFESMQRGSDPDAFLGSALAARVPEPVSYVETGDFTGDKRPDVLVAAQRGGLYLLAGDGKGGVAKARSIPLPGPVTTLTAGEFRAADGRSDVAVGAATPQGPELLLYDGRVGKLARPMRLSLPGAATAIRFGSLDSDAYADLAVAAGGRVEIVHGWGRKQSPALASRVERVAHVSGVRAISIGYFIRNRDGRSQIAAAFSDGAVRLLIPRNLDTRPLRGKAFRGRAATRLRASRARRNVESQPAWHSSTAPGWRAGRTIARGATGASAQNLLTTGKLSLLDTDDLLVKKDGHGVELVRPGDSKGASQKTSRRVAAGLTQLNRSVDAPGAVLPLPQTAIGNRGMVVVGDDAVSPTVVILAATTLTVDRTDDPSGAGLTAASACTAAANDCSLRGAVQFANNPANAGSTILLGANTYTLSINGDRGCVGGGEPAATGNTVGDLEINQSTTITGVGSGSTIIRQIGTGTAANPGDRVMCLNTGFLVNLVYNFSGLTITGGRSTANNVGGGGIIGGELNNSLTLNAVRVSNNQDVPLGSLGGGGIQITGGNLTITNSLIGGTQAPCVHTDASCKSGVDRTNVNMANLATQSGGAVAYTPSSPAHAGGTGTLTVTGTTISRNTAGGLGGGGFDLMIFAFASPGGIGSGSASISTSTIDNNSATAGNGGAIVVESLPTTVASSSITSNSASNAGGGIYVGTGGLTLNGTSPSTVTLSGNTAGGGGSSIGTAFNVTVQGTGVTLGGDVLISGGGNWTNSPGSVIAPTDVTISGGTFNANDSTTNISGNFTFSPTPGNEIAFPGTFNSGTGTFNFVGAGAQSITGPNSPTFNNLVVNKPSGTLTQAVNSSVKSNLTVNAGVFDLGAFTANRTAAGGTLTVANGSTLKIGGSNSLPANYATHALGASGTVEYNGAGAQTITGTNYGNLTSSSTGGRTLPSGQTVGVAGAFTPGTNAYTVAGSTVNFNGSGGQTIPAFAYNNLTSSSTGARTLASSGTVGVAGVFTPGSNAYTVTGSTVSFNGPGAQTIPAFTFNNLTDVNTAATVSLAAAITVNGALTVSPGAVLDTTTFVLTANGTYTNNGQIRHSANQNLTTTAGPFNFADGLGVETARLSGLSGAFGSTTANTAAGGSNPFNSCGALPSNAVRRFWQVTPASSGTGLARFSFRDDEVAGGLSPDQLAIYRCPSGGGSWAQVGTTYTRPAPTGPAPGFSSVEATEVPFNSAATTYVVAQGTPDLTVQKTNDVSGAGTVGSPWTWTLHVANGGTSNAAFTAGQTILADNLPDTNISYGTASVANVGSGVTGGANISCGIVSNNLTCTANGGPVTLGTTGGSFDVVFTATPTSTGTFANPRGGGTCSVDPNNVNAEGNEGNNGCNDSVTVTKTDTTTTITSDGPDPSVNGQTVVVKFTVVPTGSGTPTGNVEVSDGVDTCTGTVAGGSCNLALTTVGARTLTAHYVGDANFNESTSAGEPHTVNTAGADVPPTGVDDFPARIDEDSGAHLFRVRTNDLNADGGPFVVESVSDPAHGTAALANGGLNVTYTPDPDYCNPSPQPDDTFTYTLNGGSTATVSVNVNCVDDPPTAVDDSPGRIAEDSGAHLFRVRANDLNADGGKLVVESVSDPAHGTTTIVGGGRRVSYTPDPDYCNPPPEPDDTFTYTLNGGSTATVSVNVKCVAG